ncbi:hypothetical protein CIL03_04965 [Virgibacillus indicus]|uniref:Lipoprotein n=1 Tax=Virgibacillus indicus TaxID=2024554 RepID=A0A265NF92_9BACI|nr:hypothetical protein [Virgibacillus indicus]OZU90501.1 hypothetical protein CIL03_04965 [Virgibacillus indicus]
MKKWIAMLSFYILVACTNNEPAIVKTESPPDDSSREPELVEEVSGSEDDVEEFIEFPLHDEQIRINLEMVPILDAYLLAAKDRQKAIEGMKIERIQAENASIYLLEFSCQNERCSYLLFNRDAADQAFLLADLADAADMIPSPDQTKMLFLFDRKGSLPLPFTNIVIIDLEKWDHLTLVNETTDDAVLNFTWPLISVNWIDNESIAAEKPAVLEPTDEAIHEWYQANQSLTTSIILHVSENN